MDTRKELNQALIKHYVCFQTERFYLDNVGKFEVMIQTSSISDTCPFNLCKWIAEFVKRFYQKHNLYMPHAVYVGAYFFVTGLNTTNDLSI